MRTAEMIVPIWREFPGRVVRLAFAALVITTSLSVPRATGTDSHSPAERPAQATTTTAR